MQIPVVDIFAGPGGLGEGFSAFTPNRKSKTSPFRIVVSAEMEVNAARTLRLRAFFRQFPQGHAPASYYEYVAGRRAVPWTTATESKWQSACREAQQLTLGDAADDALLYERIGAGTKKDVPWVLIGGPPCQAYSLVGRSRNQGISGYSPEDDHRHFLYRHYLHIIQRFRPAAFVMENVKGILSSKVGGVQIFSKILEDLQRPGGKKGPRYQIIPLLVPMSGRIPSSGSSYLLRAEELGVPQARHRVVLLGLSEGFQVRPESLLVSQEDRYSVEDVIRGLPKLRSGITDAEFDRWPDKASSLLSSTARAVGREQSKVAKRLDQLSKSAAKTRDPGSGGRWIPKTSGCDSVPAHLSDWLLDPKLGGELNHEVRGHMETDLRRYAYAAAFAQEHGYSPRGAEEFPDALHPAHRNWDSGKFVDRFKVQQWQFPSSTVTSHLSKDGHYFIHPDAAQIRSLSVREAARLQTFPDNYFFEGARGAQFKQVGNAVPPWMARQIASVVHAHLSG
jgi:DNA (cytosine-5)-methyltransferase 1